MATNKPINDNPLSDARLKIASLSGCLMRVASVLKKNMETTKETVKALEEWCSNVEKMRRERG